MTDNIMENKKETHLEEILEKVKEGKVVLFLGAGASLMRTALVLIHF